MKIIHRLTGCPLLYQGDLINFHQSVLDITLSGSFNNQLTELIFRRKSVCLSGLCFSIHLLPLNIDIEKEGIQVKMRIWPNNENAKISINNHAVRNIMEIKFHAFKGI